MSCHSASDIDQLKTVIDEVERLHSNNNSEDKHKIHKLLQECIQVLLAHTSFNVKELFQITFYASVYKTRQRKLGLKIVKDTSKLMVY